MQKLIEGKKKPEYKSNLERQFKTKP